MDIPLYIVIFLLLVIILVLIFRPRRVEVPAIEELENKLRFALASADSVREIRDTLEDLPHDVLESITRSLGRRTGKLNELIDAKMVNYVPLSVQRIGIAEHIDTV